VRAASVRAAVAYAPPDRIVFAKGRLVARTAVERMVVEPAGDAGPTGDATGDGAAVVAPTLAGG
jgi:hypothetical protein